MASKSINIHANDFVFPGEFHKYFWKFPVVRKEKRVKVNSTFTESTIYVGITENINDVSIIEKYMNPLIKGKKNPNFNPDYDFKDFALPLKKEYFDHTPIIYINNKLIYGFIVTDSHHEGGQTSFGSITFVDSGKNLEKRNATNIFTQAMRNALSIYNKKAEVNIKNNEGILSPMLASGDAGSDNIQNEKINILLNKQPDGFKFLICQYKYDGIRMMAKLDSNNNVINYSRGRNNLIITDEMILDIRNFINEIKSVNLDFENIILDGELFIPGYHLNDISGYTRNENKNNEGKKLLKFYVFDIYIDSTTNAIVRSNILRTFSSRGTIEIVKSWNLGTTEDIMKLYRRALRENFEGLILRLPDRKYEPGDNNYHSKNMIKVKPNIRDEFKCIGYEVGKGKSSNEISLIFSMSKKNIENAKKYLIKKEMISTNKLGLTFKAKLKNFSVEKQIEMIQEFRNIEPNGATGFENNYKGKKFTVEFQDYSLKKLIPTRANMISLY